MLDKLLNLLTLDDLSAIDEGRRIAVIARGAGERRVQRARERPRSHRAHVRTPPSSPIESPRCSTRDAAAGITVSDTARLSVTAAMIA